MSAPTEKHREAARDIMAQACLPEHMVKNGVHSAIQNDIVAALAQAEREDFREGMKRAAEICRAYEDEQDKTVRASAVRRAILSECEEEA